MKETTGIELLSIMLLAILAAFILVLAKADAASFDLLSRIAQKKAGAIVCGLAAAGEKTGSKSRTKKDSDKDPGGNGCLHQMAASLCHTHKTKRRNRNKMFHHKNDWEADANTK